MIDDHHHRPHLRVLTDPAPPNARMTDSLFEISRLFGLLSKQFERLFVAWSDELHGEPDDSQ